jgi:hypothetical protein
MSAPSLSCVGKRCGASAVEEWKRSEKEKMDKDLFLVGLVPDNICTTVLG